MSRSLPTSLPRRARQGARQDPEGLPLPNGLPQPSPGTGTRAVHRCTAEPSGGRVATSPELSADPGPGLEAAGPAPAGATVGVEEEFHLVDPATLALAPSPALAEAALRGDFGSRIHAEITTTQLETVTGICRSLADVRAEITGARLEAVAAAQSAGVAILAASTHPFGTWQQQSITHDARYEAMVERWAALALQQDICGCHVHVGVPDLETAVAVMDRARPYLPVLLAMTGSSPFHGGIDTGYESYRTVWWSRWPVTGIPEHFGSAERYLEVVEGMVVSGVVADASNLYWDVRPSWHLPTLEFRLADVCTDVDAAVLHAALVRSLVRVLAARAERGDTCPRPPPNCCAPPGGGRPGTAWRGSCSTR